MAPLLRELAWLDLHTFTQGRRCPREREEHWGVCFDVAWVEHNVRAQVMKDWMKHCKVNCRAPASSVACSLIRS